MGENTKIEWTTHTLANECGHQNTVEQQFRRFDIFSIHPFKNIFIFFAAVARRTRRNEVTADSLTAPCNGHDVIQSICVLMAVCATTIKKHCCKSLLPRSGGNNVSLALVYVGTHTASHLWNCFIAIAYRAIYAASALTLFSKSRGQIFPLIAFTAKRQAVGRHCLSNGRARRLWGSAESAEARFPVVTRFIRRKENKRPPKFTFPAALHSLLSAAIVFIKRKIRTLCGYFENAKPTAHAVILSNFGGFRWA